MNFPKLNLNMPEGKRLNRRRLIVVFSIILALVAATVFVNKAGLTAFIVKEEKEVGQACIDGCSFEGKICEDAKIFECATGEDGCKQKILVEECPENAVCSTLKEDACYTPKTCDSEFHTCFSTSLYQLCKGGKTVENADTKKCPEGLVCNQGPKFAICIEKR